MEQKDLNKKIQELEAKLEEATRPKSRWYERLIKKTSFVHGFIFSVLVTSAVGIAFTLPGASFTSGTVISSADVNAKFAAIEAKLNELDVGFVANMSGSSTATCGATTWGPVEVMAFDTAGKNDGNFNIATFEYTVASNGYYRVAAKVLYPGYSGMSELYVQVNGVNKFSAGQTAGMAPGESIMFLNAGDVLRIIARCDDKGGKAAASMTVAGTESIFALSLL